jgi:hypothetical protein
MFNFSCSEIRAFEQGLATGVRKMETRGATPVPLFSAANLHQITVTLLCHIQSSLFEPITEPITI